MTDCSWQAWGYFITVEGIEGAGKSTAMPVLAEMARHLGYEVEMTREPGGGALGERLRGIFLDPGLELDADEELLLLYAGRLEHVRRRILPALASGKVVICDRFEDSTFAYQGGGRHVPLDRINALSSWAGLKCTPDLTFWLDVSPEVGAGRIRSRERDRLEREGLDFFRSAREMFGRRMEADPGRFCRIDAGLSLEEIGVCLQGELQKRLPGRT